MSETPKPPATPRREAEQPTAYIFAGANGAGKTSAASALLPSSIPLERFVNSDLIARHLRHVSPETAALAAGRLALAAVADFVTRRDSFGLETTLSGAWSTALLDRLARQRYDVVLLYFWLPSADMAVARVRGRVAAGGHDVPKADIRRRFDRSLVNFAAIRERHAVSWTVIDGRNPTSGVIAQRRADDIQVSQPDVWAEVESGARHARQQRSSRQVNTHGAEGTPPTPQTSGGSATPMPTAPSPTRPASPPRRSEAMDLRDPAAIPAAILFAHRMTVLRHRALHAPLVVVRDGVIVEIDPYSIGLPDEAVAATPAATTQADELRGRMMSPSTNAADDSSEPLAKSLSAAPRVLPPGTAAGSSRRGR